MGAISYVSLEYFLLIAVVFVAYHIVSLKHRWAVLLCGSMAFYLLLLQSWVKVGVFLFTVVVSYLFGIWLDAEAVGKGTSESNGVKAAGSQDSKRKADAGMLLARRWALWIGIILCAIPFAVSRVLSYGVGIGVGEKAVSIWDGMILPMGAAFYTLQMIAYLVDVYHGKARAQRNFGKYLLFIAWFPQVIQGPIPRYGDLDEQLVCGHRFDEREFIRGFQLIIWGFFLKFMIADKAGIVVDEVFDHYEGYAGAYYLVAGIGYSIQLYADFYACTTISQGVSELFGIHLGDNFRRPYFAVSIADFWRRWHISLSMWLRDDIYIPLGGNRKGKARKYFNVMVTFLVSGFWHGSGWKFLFWGALHGIYQLTGALTASVRSRIRRFLRIPEHSHTWRILKMAGTWLWVGLAWIIFRAPSLRVGLHMIRSIFTTWNPWVLFDDSLLALGLSWKEWNVLLASILVLLSVSWYQERHAGSAREHSHRGPDLRDRILSEHVLLRWSVCILAIVSIAVFGTYGAGFEAQDFIYGGF